MNKLKRLGARVWHVIVSFLIGLAVATVFNAIVTNHQVKSGAEKICAAFSRNEQECRAGIDSVLELSNNEVQNNIQVTGE